MLKKAPLSEDLMSNNLFIIAHKFLAPTKESLWQGMNLLKIFALML